MLAIVQLEFNHDYRDKDERFEAFAAVVSREENFASGPLIETSPVFTYCRTGRNRLDSLFARMGDGDAIIFLSDICSYSYALLQSDSYPRGLSNVVAIYESRLQLRDNPRICGSCATDQISLRIDPADATFVGMMPSAYSGDLVDENTELPNPEIVDVLVESPGDGGSVFAYRLRDHSRYFNLITRSEWVTHVIPGTMDAKLAMFHYRHESLTEFLQSSGRAFGTLNDNHQDDCYAVSYFRPIWNVPDETLAFVA